MHKKIIRAITEVVLYYLSFQSGLRWGRIPQLPLLGLSFSASSASRVTKIEYIVTGPDAKSKEWQNC
jgi:hypothetical protein